MKPTPNTDPIARGLIEREYRQLYDAALLIAPLARATRYMDEDTTLQNIVDMLVEAIPTQLLDKWEA